MRDWKESQRPDTSPVLENGGEQERLLELRDLGDGTAQLRFRDQLPLELVDKIRAVLKSGRASTGAVH